MASVTLYDNLGKSIGSLELDAKVFGVEVNPTLVHEALLAQEKNARVAIAHTKTRGEVRGGGRKPWRQKGTGRARHGSRRSPIWVGGGITFGPRNERNFSVKINKKARRNALRMVLSDRAANEQIVAVDPLTLEDAKTKQLNTLLTALPSKDASTLLIVSSENMNVRRAAQNLPHVKAIGPNSLNVKDLLVAKYIVASKEAIEAITKTYGA